MGYTGVMNTPPKGLSRVVSTPMLALYGIGNIVGAGVYVLVGKIAEPAGYLAILAFIIAALVAFTAALSYAELAARFPVSGGISVYLYEAFKAKRFATIVGIALVAAGTISTATLLKGFGGYLYSLVPIHPTITMAVVAAMLLALTLKGIKESVGVAAVLTIIEVGGLIFLMASVLIAQPGTLANFGENFVHSLQTIDSAALAGILAASFIAFYAFIGFEDMVNIAEEVKEPQKAFPKAILSSIVVVTILYIAVAVVVLGILSPQVLGDSSAPLSDTYQAATGNTAGIIGVISLMAILNGVIVNIIMGSRFLYGLSTKGWVTSWFAKVNRRHVPAHGLIVVAVAALVCAILFPIEHLAQTTSLLLLFVFCAVNVSLVVIRRGDVSDPKLRAPRISPSFMPWLGALTSGALLTWQLVTIASDLF